MKLTGWLLQNDCGILSGGDVKCFIVIIMFILKDGCFSVLKAKRDGYYVPQFT